MNIPMLALLLALPTAAHEEESFALSPRAAVVLKEYPLDPSLFQDDIRPSVKKIVSLHGPEEWKAAVLTNELHRHLGTYSIVGAKMGVRAREILAAPFDSLEVVSEAGSRPPLSCLTDGLQVATGASLGRGAIRVEGGSAAAAIFSYKGRRLRLALKKELQRRIDEEQSALVKRFGGMGPEYFAEVRRLSLRWWEELDRRTAFEERPL